MKKITSSLIACTLAVLSVKAQNVFPAAGRTGVNTVTPASALQVVGGARIGSLTNYANIDSLTGNLSFAGTSTYRVANNQFAFSAATAPLAGLYFNATNVRYEFRNTSGVSMLNIGADATGKVGIGSTSPGEKLTVVDPANDKYYSGIMGVYANNLTQGVGIGYAGIAAIGSNASQDLSINAKNKGNITMQVPGFGTTGNVGIGTASPNNKLSVVGGADFSGNVGIGVTSPDAQLRLSNTVANRKIVLFQIPNGDTHLFYGFGVNNYVMRYQVDGTLADHVFYAGTSATTSNELMRIKGNGNVTIGTPTPATGYMLTVGGKIICTEVKVQLQPFPDYVFSKSYKLPTLNEVEDHINTYHRLPGMPSAAEVESNGMEVGKMQGKVVEKVEEATLYILQLNKENQQLKQQLDDLSKTVMALQAQIDALKK